MEDFAKERVSQSFVVYCIGVGKIAALADVSATWMWGAQPQCARASTNR
jgi:hypothetical protein